MSTSGRQAGEALGALLGEWIQHRLGQVAGLAEQYAAANGGQAPTAGEVARALDLSPAAVACYLERVARGGGNVGRS